MGYWLFPEKSKRLLVGLAGPAFELFLWSVATILWRYTETDTWIHRLALVVLAISGLKTLINFNPFIKLDGYYLLSDILGKDPQTTVVVIDEVETDNWGIAGESITARRKRSRK